MPNFIEFNMVTCGFPVTQNDDGSHTRRGNDIVPPRITLSSQDMRQATVGRVLGTDFEQAIIVKDSSTKQTFAMLPGQYSPDAIDGFRQKASI